MPVKVTVHPGNAVNWAAIRNYELRREIEERLATVTVAPGNAVNWDLVRKSLRVSSEPRLSPVGSTAT